MYLSHYYDRKAGAFRNLNMDFHRIGITMVNMNLRGM